MTDVKRIQELILTVGQRAALGSPLHEDEAEAVNAALSELARIKGAALSVPEIEKRHADHIDAVRRYTLRFGNPCIQSEAELDRATLLDALRAKEAEISQLEGELAEALEAQTPLMDAAHLAKQDLQALQQSQRELLAMANCRVEELKSLVARGEAERDAARAQLGQAQKEIERLTSEKTDALTQRDQISAYFAKVILAAHRDAKTGSES